MKKLKTVYSIFFTLFIGILFLNNSANPPNGRTGAPGESTCSSCHNQNGNFDGILDITGLPSNIQPSTTYPITVTVNVTSGSPMRAGFQLVALDGNDSNIGTITPTGGGTTIQSSGGRTYVEHNPAKNFSGGMVTYTFDWEAPTSAGGNSITFYSASLMGNGSGTNGDKTLLTSVSGTLASAPNPPTISVDSQNDVSCFGGNDGSATVSASGGTPPYNFTWTGGLTGATQNNLAAGTYMVTVTDNAQETASTMVTISEPSDISVILLSQTNIDCFVNTGSAEVEATGGTPPYIYNWSNGETGPFASNLPAGISTVDVRDQNLCLQSFDVMIASDIIAPLVDAGTDMVLDCNSTTVVLNGTGSMGGNFTYLWTTMNGNIISGANTFSATVDQPGNYILTISDATNGCQASDEAIVTNNIVSLTAVIEVPDELNCNNSIVTLDANGSSTGSSITYLWVTNNGNIVSGANSLTPIVDQPGNYILTVIDTSTGCSNTTTVSVTQNITPPIVNLVASSELTCDITSVDVDASGSTGQGTLSFNWLNGATTPTIQVLFPSTLILTVTDQANGCTAMGNITVTQNTTAPTAIITASANELTCTNTSITLDGSQSSGQGSITYLWNDPSASTTSTITIGSAGTYGLTVTDSANGCTDTTSITITQDAQVPIIDIAPFGELNCTNTTLTLDASGSSTGNGFMFSWSTPDGNIVSGATTLTPVIDAPGSYTLQINNINSGCLASSTVTVIEDRVAPNVVIVPPAALNCFNATVQLDASQSAQGNITYQWMTTDGNIVAGSNSPIATVDAGGTYSLIISNNDNGCESSEMVFVNTIDPLIILVSADNILCFGDSTGVAQATPASGTGPYSFLWSTGDIQPTILNLTAGIYTVTVTDSDSCQVVETVEITQPDEIAISLTTMDVNCPGGDDGSATIVATGGTGGFDFVWSFPDPSQLPAGDYSVSVSDANSCFAMTDFIISEPPILNVNFTVIDESAFMANDGSIQVDNITGGTPPYSYLWSNGDTTSIIQNLPPGNYTLQITDGNDCIYTDSVTVAAFGCDGFAINFATPFNIDCRGFVMAEFNIVNGTPPYQYIWSNGQTDSIGIVTDTFSVTVTDASGCVATEGFHLNLPPTLNMMIDSIQNATGNDANGSASVTTTGGAAPFQHAWMDSTGNIISNTSELDSVPAGTYSVVVIDANGCSIILTVVIGSDPSTSINDPAFAEFVNIYPNPSTGRFQIDFDLLSENEFEIDLYSFAGRLIEHRVHDTRISTKVVFNKEALPSGVYLLKIQSEEGVLVKRLIFE